MELAKRLYGRVFAVATGLLIVAALLGRQLSPRTALAILILGVVFLGLPHGALDPMVASQTLSLRNYYRRISFYAVYLALVLMFGLLWSHFPTLGLSLFLLISALHFGTDWELRGIAPTRFAYGLAVVTLPALRFPAEVASVYGMLGTTHATAFVTISSFLAPIALAAAAWSAALRFRDRASDGFELAVIAAGAVLLEPLVYFTCYFALLHSPRHLFDTAEGLGIRSLRRICSETLPIVAATLLLALIVYVSLPRTSLDISAIRIVFAGLAALTVPHMLLDALAHGLTERHCDRDSLA